MVLPLLIALGIATVASLLAPAVAKEAAKQTQADVKQYVDQSDVVAAKQAASQRIDAEASSNLGSSIIRALPGIGIATSTGKMESYTKEELMKMGWSESEASKAATAVKKEQEAAAIGEGVGVLIPAGGAAGLATKIGEKTVGKAIAETATKEAVKA